MNSKGTLILNQRLEKIALQSFNEDDIKLFLIEIRDYLESESILREVCDFIAHPKRNRGICHRRVDSRYAKQKFAKEGAEALDRQKVFELNPDKPWSFFSDKILDYIQTDKIPKNLFSIIIREGIEEIDAELFVKHYGLSRKDVKALIDTSYKLNGNYYYLESDASKKGYLFIDDLLKFVRGTITGKSAFGQTELEADIMNAVGRLADAIPVTIKPDSIKVSLSDIMICILCIIHDTDFLLFDGKIAKSYLSCQQGEHGDGTFCLMVNADNFSFPIISTSIKVHHYVTGSLGDLSKLEVLPWVFPYRGLDSKLYLSKRPRESKH